MFENIHPIIAILNLFEQIFLFVLIGFTVTEFASGIIIRKHDTEKQKMNASDCMIRSQKQDHGLTFVIAVLITGWVFVDFFTMISSFTPTLLLYWSTLLTPLILVTQLNAWNKTKRLMRLALIFIVLFILHGLGNVFLATTYTGVLFNIIIDLVRTLGVIVLYFYVVYYSIYIATYLPKSCPR